MKALLILKRLQVQNANAINGLTWGFPAVSNFLGFVHALSRFTQAQQGVRLDGCGVVCHNHEVQAYQPSGYGEYVFALTRNPLSKEGKTAPFNEEGRMHMEVSLVIECDFIANDLDYGTGSDSEDIERFKSELANKIETLRLAGGTIQAIEQVEFYELDDDHEFRSRFFRKTMLRLLPGFLLVDRTPLLNEHFTELLQHRPDADLLDAWLDFAALRYRAYPDLSDGELPSETTPAQWRHESKPGEGWLVPITTGFKAISPLYEPGQVANTRDSAVPFQFVESVYGIGQWISPHRIRDINSIFWRHQHEDGWYLCKNSYQPEINNAL